MTKPTVFNYADYEDALQKIKNLEIRCRIAEAEAEDLKDKIPKWIPVEEWLPEITETGTSDMVLLCWSDGQRTVGAYQGNRTFVGQAWPAAKDSRVTVVAWMPLPEPYRRTDE